MQVSVQRVGVAPGRVEQRFALLVDIDDAVHRVAAGGERADQPPVEIAELVVPESALLGFPHEAAPVVEKAHRRAVALPRALYLGDDHARRERGDVYRHDLEHVLMSVGAVKEQVCAIRRETHLVHVVLRRGAHRHARQRAGPHVVEHQAGDRVGFARLGIALACDARATLGQAVEQIEILDAALVELVEGQLRGVGRPPHRGRLSQLLAVHPARLTVAVLAGAVRRDLDDLSRRVRVLAPGTRLVRRFQDHVPISAHRHPAAIG